MDVDNITKRHSAISAQELAEARDQLHHAVQTIPSVARAFLSHEPDDSHTNMGWDVGHRALIGHPVQAESYSFQIGLRIDEPAVLFFHHGRGEVDSLPLDTVTLANVQTWLEESIAESGLDASQIDWRPGYDIPEHAVFTRSVPFNTADLKEAASALGVWFENGFGIMQAAAKNHHADGPRCWPHHFDVGTLIFFGQNSKGEEQTVGLGLSPGDAYYAEPYYYVSPYPAGDSATLPALTRGGQWHTQDFVSSVLTAPVIRESQDQVELVVAYLDESIRAAKSRLELTGQGGNT